MNAENFNRKKVFYILAIIILAALATPTAFKLVANVSSQLAAVRGVGEPSQSRAADARVRTSNVTIRSDGEVRLTGVTVETVSGGRFTAVGQIGTETQTFTINSDDQTVVNGSGGVISTLDAITVGATLMVSGIFQDFSPHLTILAKEIRASGIKPAISDLNKSALLERRDLPKLPAKMIALAESALASELEPVAVESDSTSESGSEPEPEATTTPPVAEEPPATTTEPVVEPEPEASTTPPVVEEPPATTTEPAVEPTPEPPAPSEVEEEPEPEPATTTEPVS